MQATTNSLVYHLNSSKQLKIFWQFHRCHKQLST